MIVRFAFWHRRGLALVVSALVLPAVGCAVPVHQHRYLARPAMQFRETAADRLFVGLLAQTETGAAVSGGALAAGCASCR